MGGGGGAWVAGAGAGSSSRAPRLLPPFYAAWRLTAGFVLQCAKSTRVGVADVKIPTTRKTITLSLLSVRRLELLASDGWFGSDVSGVAARLIESGLQRARRDGYLPDDRLAEAKAVTAKQTTRGRRSSG